MRRVIKEYQNLIAGIALALSIGTAAASLLVVSFRVGQAMQQHQMIIDMQGRTLTILTERCK